VSFTVLRTFGLSHCFHYDDIIEFHDKFSGKDIRLRKAIFSRRVNNRQSSAYSFFPNKHLSNNTSLPPPPAAYYACICLKALEPCWSVRVLWICVFHGGWHTGPTPYIIHYTTNLEDPNPPLNGPAVFSTHVRCLHFLTPWCMDCTLTRMSLKKIVMIYYTCLIQKIKFIIYFIIICFITKNWNITY
jgi:hypothetical protein